MVSPFPEYRHPCIDRFRKGVCLTFSPSCDMVPTIVTKRSKRSGQHFWVWRSRIPDRHRAGQRRETLQMKSRSRGPDWALSVLTREHAPFDLRRMDARLVIAHTLSFPVLVRAASISAEHILHVLDSGTLRESWCRMLSPLESPNGGACREVRSSRVRIRRFRPMGRFRFPNDVGTA